MAKEIPLSRGLVATVDDEDYEWLSQWKWCVSIHNKCYRAVARINGKQVLMHRLILNAPKGKLVDHADGNGLNNQKSNLRFCNRQQNAANSLKWNRKTTSKFKGVTWRKARNKWAAQICYNYRNIGLGYFEHEEEAARAYDRMAKKFFGEFAFTNFG